MCYPQSSPRDGASWPSVNLALHHSMASPIFPLPHQFSWEDFLFNHSHMIFFSWNLLLWSFSQTKHVCQMIEKPCRLFASKIKKGNLLHMLNFKNQSCKLMFFRKRIWRRRRISGDPRHHQGTVRQIWVQSSKWGLLSGCQTSQGHCELWVWQQAAGSVCPGLSTWHEL